MNIQVYDQITARMIALLEQGTVPWHKPWKARTAWPRNLVTKKPYRGVNVFLLTSTSYQSPWWLTVSQATDRGGSILKGEKPCAVLFSDRKTMTDKETGEERNIPLLRLYSLFNVAQCEGLGDISKEMPESEVPAKPAEIVAKMPMKPRIKHGMTESCYSPREDCVSLPLQKRLGREGEYYSALFRELIHATGHERRLNRRTLTEKAGYGVSPYCKEELIAEMGAVFLCAEAEIVERTIDNSPAYVQGWLEQLKNDRTLIVQAAAQAQRAADFILGKLPQEFDGNGVESNPQPEPEPAQETA